MGAGGGGFPTHRKLARSADTLIINGAECEPLLCKDKYLLHHEQLLLNDGIKLARGLLGAEKVILAVKADIRLENALTLLLDDFYPAGDEHLLTWQATKRLVPEGGFPLDVGVCVLNVETLWNLGNGRPVTRKLVPVLGEVTHPGVYSVPIGMNLRELAERAGAPKSGVTLIHGGPMMGDMVRSNNATVSRVTAGLLVLPDSHPIILRKTQSLEQVARRARSNCIQCQFCTELCPRALLGHGIKPHLAMRSFAYNLNGVARERAGLASCSGCGVCEQYACPLDLSPRIVIKHLQNNVCPSEKGSGKPHQLIDDRRTPRKRLITRLGLEGYRIPTPSRVMEAETNRVEISLIAHGGAFPEATVKKSERVNLGDVIAESDMKTGVPVHASLSGTVTQVGKDRVVIER